MNTKIFTCLFNQTKLLSGLLWLVCMLSAGTAVGQSTGWLSPSSNSGTGGGVTSPQNAYASDNQYADFNMTSDNAAYYGFNIAIPSGKVVKGVEVLVEGHKIFASVRDFKLSLSWNGGINYTGVKTTTGIPSADVFGSFTDGTVYVGGAADNWGWNAITFTNFRVKVETTTGVDYTDHIYLDLIQVNITYGDITSPLIFNYGDAFIVPPCVSTIKVEAWGGGGAGGGSTLTYPTNYKAGAGGGGGAYASKFLTVTPGTTLSVIVGSGGSGSSGSNGANGNPSYIDGKQSLIYAAGGTGGIANTSGGSPGGGAGGSIANSTGDNVTAGGTGGNGTTGSSVTSGAGGAGGNGGLGGIGVSSASNTLGNNGNPGNPPGGGGSGSLSDGGNQKGGNGGSGRVILTWVVNTTSAPTGAASQTICHGGTLANLVVTGDNIKWYDALNDGTLLPASSTLIDGTTYYASQTVSGCESIDRLAVTVTINEPQAPTGDETQVLCNSATVANLVATGTGIKWYDEEGALLSNETALSNGALYFASQTISGCESKDRLKVTAVISTPQKPSGSETQTFCNSATVGELKTDAGGIVGFLGPVGVIKWYDVATGGTELQATTPLENGKTYYAAGVMGACESVERFAVAVTINKPDPPEGPSPQTFCTSATVASLSAAGTEIKWYNVAIGGTALDAGTSLQSGATYYASQTIDGCESIDRLAVDAVIIAPGAPTGESIQTFCNSAILDQIEVKGFHISWYNADNVLLDHHTPVVNGQTYYARQRIEGCLSVNKLAVTTMINVVLKPTGNEAQTFCNSATVGDLVANGEGYIMWYDENGNWLSNDMALISGATYYASQIKDECESADRLAVTATISIPEITGQLNVCAGSTRQLTGNGTPATTNPWTSSDETIATVSTTGLVSGIKAGNVTITYTNSFGCSKQETFVVKPLPQPTFIMKPTSPQSTGVNLTYTTESGMQSYSWTYSDAAQALSNPCGYTRTGGGNTNSSTIKWRTEGEKTVTVSYSSDGCAAATPATYTITLCHPVSITTQPAANTTYQYTCTVPTLSVAAKYTNVCTTLPGYDGLTYQWYSNQTPANSGGTKIDGATAATFTPPANGVGDYYYYVVVTRNSCSAISSVAHIKVDPAPVEPVEAVYLYKGPTDAWTSGATSNIASVPLLVHIKNQAGQCGDITTARVTFLIKTATGWDPVPGASNLPVNYIDPNVPSKGGAASTLAQFNIGSNNADVIELKIVVGGNYTGAELTSITIARPTPGGLICGAAFLCNTNSTGFIKGATGNILLPFFSPLNFYVAYNKSLKNPQGKVNLFVPSYNRPDGTVDNVLHLYAIRSNAISSLVVTKPTASFISKANVSEVFIDLGTLAVTEVLLEGNCKVVMDMTDGSPDKVGITVYRNKGGIWYANNWSGGKTVQQALCLGSLTVTGVASGSLTRSAGDYATLPAITVTEPFDVTVQSNPTSDRFILKVQGSLERIDIRVMDINGKVVEVRNQLTPGTPVYLGANYIAGVYMAEVIQGPNRKMIKLVKQ